MVKYLKAMIGTVGKEKLFVASDDVEDRQGEVIEQTGWDLTNFKLNPVIQWAHNGNEPAIATADKIGFKTIDGKQKLVYSPVFHRKTPMSNYIGDLVEAGVIKASSVGFKPIEMVDNRYTKSELLEISFVNVPANQNALSLGLSKGYSMDVIKSVMPDIEVKSVEVVVEEEVTTPAEEALKEVVVEEEKVIEESTEEKGLIADQVTSDEMMDAKYEKMDKFWDIVYAFCDVYFKDETTTDQFEPLLAETSDILKSLSQGIADEAGIKSIKVDRKVLIKFITEETEVKKSKEEEEEVEVEVPVEIPIEEEKSMTNRIEELESTVLGLSDGFKKMDIEISEKLTTIVETIKNDVKTYLTSQSEAKAEEKGVSGREPKIAVESQDDKNRRLAMKVLNKAVEILNKNDKK